jgi:hypothetical protein
MAQSLIADARALSEPQRAKSKVYLVADTMPDALRAELAEALADRTVTVPGLAKALRARGYDLSESSIQHFRERGYSL